MTFAATYTRLADGAFAVGDVSIPSPLAEVSSAAWTRFVRAMITAPLGAVSDSNALGMFEMRPRRLSDLGLLVDLRHTKSPKTKKTVWVGRFVPPLTSDHFLTSVKVQYQVFAQSMIDYARRMLNGEISQDSTMSLSGALAVLHRCGPSGLKSWSEGLRFPATVELYQRTAGIF